MKFTIEVAEGILKDIADGIPYKLSCESFGIAYPTFKVWLQNGARDLSEGKNTIYGQFLSSIREVQKDVVKGHLSSIRSSDKGHRGKEWELERSYWHHFSSNSATLEFNERLEKLEQKNEVQSESESEKNESE